MIIKELVNSSISFEGNLTVTIIFLALASLLLFLSFKKGRKSGKKKIDYFLIILRALTFILILVFFLKPVKLDLFKLKKEKPIIIVTDQTASFKKSDKQVKTELKQIKNKKFAYKTYIFSPYLREVPFLDLFKIIPQGQADLNTIFQELKRKFLGKKISAFAFISDFKNKEPLSIKSIPLNYPLYFFKTKTKISNKLYVKTIKFPQYFWQKEENKIKILLKSPTNKTEKIKIKLLENFKPLKEEKIVFHQEKEVELKFIPKSIGENLYQILFYTEKEKEPFLEIKRFQKVEKSRINLLFLASPLNYDYKFLNLTFTINKMIKLYHYYYPLLKKNLKLEDKNIIKKIEPKTLKPFDVIVIGITSKYPTETEIDTILNWAQKNQKGIFIFPLSRDFYKNKIVFQKLKLKIIKFEKREVKITPSSQAIFHPIIKLSDSSKLNRIIWQNLPPLSGYFKFDTLPPTTFSLLKTTDKKTDILFFYKVGSADLIFLNSLGWWKWYFNVLSYQSQSEEYLKFINNLVSYLGKISDFQNIKLSLSETNKELSTDTTPLFKAHLQLLDEKLSPLKTPQIKAKILTFPDKKEIKSITFQKKEEGNWEAGFKIDKEGLYLLQVEIKTDKKKWIRERKFSLYTPLEEFFPQKPIPDKQLRNILLQSGGKLLEIKKIREINKIIPIKYQQTTQLEKKDFSNNKLIWILILILLTIEWVVRKKYGI